MITSEESLKISAITSTGWAKYKKIRLETLLNEPQAFSSDFITAAGLNDLDWQATLSNPDNAFFLAEFDYRPVGIIRLSYNDPYFDHDTAAIGGLYVNKDYRQMGIAKSLINKAIAQAKQKPGITNVQLTVKKTQVTAIKLYEKLGFKQVGEEQIGNELTYKLIL